jgi:hypothetical protein
VVTYIRESRRFESMYTLQGKTRYTQHARFSRQSTYATQTLSAGNPPTWQHFASHQQRWTNPTTPEKRAPNTILSTSGDRSIGPPPSFSPNITIEAVMKAGGGGEKCNMMHDQEYPTHLNSCKLFYQNYP